MQTFERIKKPLISRFPTHILPFSQNVEKDSNPVPNLGYNVYIILQDANKPAARSLNDIGKFWKRENTPLLNCTFSFPKMFSTVNKHKMQRKIITTIGVEKTQ